jgi:hypothetical protein
MIAVEGTKTPAGSPPGPRKAKRLVRKSTAKFYTAKSIKNSKSKIDYEPLKYKCISVDDEIINSLYEQLSIMRTDFHSLDHPEFGIAYCGITIIPP